MATTAECAMGVTAGNEWSGSVRGGGTVGHPRHPELRIGGLCCSAHWRGGERTRSAWPSATPGRCQPNAPLGPAAHPTPSGAGTPSGQISHGGCRETMVQAGNRQIGHRPGVADLAKVVSCCFTLPGVSPSRLDLPCPAQWSPRPGSAVSGRGQKRSFRHSP